MICFKCVFLQKLSPVWFSIQSIHSYTMLYEDYAIDDYAIDDYMRAAAVRFNDSTLSRQRDSEV